MPTLTTAMHRLAAWLIGGWLCGHPLFSLAASLQVTPTLLEFEPQQQAASLLVENAATTPILVQAKILRWTQKQGEESFDEDSSIVLSPSLVYLAGQGQQRLRVILNTLRAPGEQASADGGTYRILIDELPVQTEAGKTMKLAIRYSIPVFFVPAGKRPAWQDRDLEWTLDLSAQPPQLVVRNNTAFPAQLADAQVLRPDGKGQAEVTTNITSGLMGYVFAGQTHQWTLPAEVAAQWRDPAISVQLNGVRTRWPIRVRKGKP